MEHAVAQSIVLSVWNGTRRPSDPAFSDALRVMGINLAEFRHLKCEAHRSEGRFPRRVILTPTSAGKRR